MTSFIFNSKLRLPVASLLVFAFLLSGYHFLITDILHSPQWFIYMSERHWNTTKAQRFLYNGDGNDYVLIGTSLSNRLPLTPDFSNNLAFDGRSPLDGLQIILESSKFPKAVLIETNFMAKGINKDFVNSLFTPVLYSLRRHIPSLREEYQPVMLFSVFLKIVSDRLNSFCLIFKNLKLSFIESQAEAKSMEVPKEVNSELFNMQLEIHRKNFSKGIEATGIENLQKFETMILELKKHKVTVIFHEMPMHPSLQTVLYISSIRNRLLQKFPEDSNKWIFSDGKRYETIDGIHLTQESAVRYIEVLKEGIAEMKRNY